MECLIKIAQLCFPPSVFPLLHSFLTFILYPSFFMQTICHSLLTVSVGYEYETCPSQVLWEKRTVVLQGYELNPSNLGGWSLDKHHMLNVRSGMLAKHFSIVVERDSYDPQQNMWFYLLKYVKM